MLITTTECKSLLNITTTVYDSLIDLYIPIVLGDIVEYTNNEFIQSYHTIHDDGLVFSSTSKTITLKNGSTNNPVLRFRAGDTIKINNSYFNNNFYTISTRSTNSITVLESIVDENSTDFAMDTKISRCEFNDSIKRIASKMVWYNVQTSTSFNGDIASESLGSYSVSYRDSGKEGFSIYPGSLLSGLRKIVNVW